MKSRHAVTTAYQLFAHASSTLLVNCLSAICKISVIAVCIPDNLNMTPYRCRPHERLQTILVAATYKSVRFARSLATRFHAGLPHLLMCVCPL